MNDTPETLRAKAAQHAQDREGSFDRCDTDGYLSQWASGLSADLCRLQATLAEQNGTAAFRFLQNSSLF